MKIENFQFSASGHVSDGHEPFQARFANLQIWCEDGSKTDAFLQVDIGGLIRIIGIATQGDIVHFNAWVKSYYVLYSKNGASWTSVTVSGKQVRKLRVIFVITGLQYLHNRKQKWWL